MTVKEAIELRDDLLNKIRIARRDVMIALTTIREAVESYCGDDTNFDMFPMIEAQQEYETRLATLIELKNDLEQLTEMKVTG